jgi:DNA-binding transcriptional LysR family regulator
MFDWDDILCFLAVARDGSPLSAARALGVDPPTLVRRIAALEAALELKLFERGQAGGRLTEAGQALLSSAEALERSGQALKDHAAARRRAGGAGLTSRDS